MQSESGVNDKNLALPFAYQNSFQLFRVAETAGGILALSLSHSSTADPGERSGVETDLQ